MPPLHTVSHSSSVLALAQVTQTRAGPRKTIDSSRIHPSAHGLFAAVAPKPIRSDEEPREALRIKQPPPGAYDENGAQKLPGSYERLHTGSTHRVSAWQGAGSCQIRPRPRVSYTPSGGSTCASTCCRKRLPLGPTGHEFRVTQRSCGAPRIGSEGGDRASKRPSTSSLPIRSSR